MPPASRCTRLVPLALLLCLACGGQPDERRRVPLAAESGAPLALEAREIGREARPATRLESGAPLVLRSGAGGRLRLGVGPAEATAPTTRLRITAGGSSVEHFVGSAPSWQTVLPGLRLADGDPVEFSVLGPGSLWLGDPVVEAPRPPSAAPLVIVILIDTIRADHTSFDGYALPTSPHLDALAADGVGFRRAYAPAPWTRPSVASLLTSLEPETHRALRRKDRLSDALVTWPEVARAAGYQTIGIVTNPNVLPTWGFAQGFGRYIDLGAKAWLKGERESDARAVFAAALAAIDGEPLPLFLYLHVLDPHHPYTPPLEAARKVHPDFRAREPGQMLPPGSPERVVRSALRRYDGEIRHTDDALGEFVAALRARGLYDSAAIVVTGDHGEEFRDHGGEYHGHTLYEEQIHVPLVMKLPNQTPTAEPVASLVSIMDALPTLAEVAGWPAPAEIDGRSLMPAIAGEGPVREMLTASTVLDGAHAYALVTPDRKLIRTLAPAPETRVYDLASDAGEVSPRADPEETAHLDRTLDRLLARRGTGWHLRLCGGRTEQAVAFALTGVVGDARTPSFDAGDAARREGERLVVEARVGADPAAPGGDAEQPAAPTADEDELLVSGGALVLEPGPGVAPRLTVGDTERPFADRVDLDPSAARLATGEAPPCALADEPSLHVWYVPEPADAAVVEPDADLRRRLQELGYMLDDEPEAAPDPGATR